MAATALDTSTFKGGTARIVSYATLVGGPAASLLETENSPALKAAKNDFAAAKAEISDFASLRASLGKRKEISSNLADKVFGSDSAQNIVVGHEDAIANAVKAAAAKYGNPEKPSASADAPSPQFLPVAAKGPREIN